MTRQKALNFIASLNQGEIPIYVAPPIPLTCGDTSNNGSSQNDWRLPNRFELESLLDLGQVDPPLPAGHPFTNVALDYYWTSSYESYYVDLGIG